MRLADQETLHGFSIFSSYGNGVTSLRSSLQAVTNHHRVGALNDALYHGRIRTVGEQERRVGLCRESRPSQKKDRTQFRVHALPIQSK